MIVAVCAASGLHTRREDAPPRLDTAIYVHGRYGGLFEGATEALCKSTTVAFDQTAARDGVASGRSSAVVARTDGQGVVLGARGGAKTKVKPGTTRVLELGWSLDFDPCARG